MMQLSGLGDPSGCGEGFSFLRKIDNRPAKAVTAGNSGLNAHVKKITGTEDDLRKLNMKEMEEILRKFGNMDTKQIKALKRWDRVHVIREISTRAASDRVGVGLERFGKSLV
jgi:transcription initiation factor TFIID subunit 1